MQRSLSGTSSLIGDNVLQQNEHTGKFHSWINYEVCVELNAFLLLIYFRYLKGREELPIEQKRNSRISSTTGTRRRAARKQTRGRGALWYDTGRVLCTHTQRMGQVQHRMHSLKHSECFLIKIIAKTLRWLRPKRSYRYHAENQQELVVSAMNDDDAVLDRGIESYPRRHLQPAEDATPDNVRVYFVIGFDSLLRTSFSQFLTQCKRLLLIF